MNLYTTLTGDLRASIKDIDGKKGIVTGYFANFDNVDSDGDIIRRGAFTKTINENGPKSNKPRIKWLMNHNASQPLGPLQTLQEDTKGLYYEGVAGTHNLGQDFIKMVESGIITEHSIGFQILKKNQLQDYDSYRSNPSKGWFEITELKLWEGSSLTAWGANSETPLTGMKAANKAELLQKMAERSKALEKFCRNSTATDETIELLLIEQKQLTQMIIDLQKDSTPPAETTGPQLDAVINTIKQFTNNLNKQ